MKRLLTTLKDKWPEYLLEIIVLVLGIYGAFALERWNDDKNRLGRERVLLTELNAEFIANMKEFQKVRESHFKGYQASLWIIKRWPDIENVNSDSLSLNIGHLFRNADLNVSQSNIEAIISTETFDIIQDQKLRKALARWPKVLESYKNIERKASDFFSDAFEPHFRATIDYQNFDGSKSNLTRSVETKNIIFVRYRTFQNIIESEEIEDLENTIQTIISLTKTQ